jgi:hypothetical protein
LDTVVGWPVYVATLGNAKRLELDDPYQEQATGHWVSTSPTSSVFTVDGGQDAVNASGDDFIAYCFHSVEGYSKVGTYAGNSNVDGPFIYTGFKPAYAIFKRTGSAASWVVFDNKRNPYNAVDTRLYPDTSGAESTAGAGYADMDFVSNGIKMRGDSAMYNNSSGPYIFYAVAESPFKTSNAR